MTSTFCPERSPTSRDFDPKNAASMVKEACRTSALLTALPVEDGPATLAEGYDVQDQLIANLGERTIGWKLGRLEAWP